MPQNKPLSYRSPPCVPCLKVMINWRGVLDERTPACLSYEDNVGPCMGCETHARHCYPPTSSTLKTHAIALMSALTAGGWTQRTDRVIEAQALVRKAIIACEVIGYSYAPPDRKRPADTTGTGGDASEAAVQTATGTSSTTAEALCQRQVAAMERQVAATERLAQRIEQLDRTIADTIVPALRALGRTEPDAADADADADAVRVLDCHDADTADVDGDWVKP
ncbi:hypothetical protein F4780DRAFT_765875 [Xylariomycetidae sp. FL0641]|nr:hypothetical protein F4780DRAFT_765875 [Xylariomycetidae sp. FL0641]